MVYVIYKICCDDCDDIYVGSSKEFRRRKNYHKRQCNDNTKRKIYEIIRSNGGWDNWRMVIIEECDETIQTKVQAEMREEEYRVKLKATMNTNRAYLSDEVKKQLQKDYHKEHYINNLEEVTEKHKNWRDNNPNYFKEWREKNQDKHLGYIHTRITCECGCDTAKQHLARHMKTAKHLNLMTLK